LKAETCPGRCGRGGKNEPTNPWGTSTRVIKKRLRRKGEGVKDSTPGHAVGKKVSKLLEFSRNKKNLSKKKKVVKTGGMHEAF